MGGYLHLRRRSGSGSLLAGVMTEGLWEAVQEALTEITHFEAVRIIREGVGVDPISDATASIIRNRLVAYTQGFCIRHKVPPLTIYSASTNLVGSIDQCYLSHSTNGM